MGVLKNYKPGVWKEPDAWIPKMRRMIAWLGDDDLRSSEALCVRVAGDFVAGMVLHKLLQWMPHGSRSDGAVWMSDRRMNAELGLTYAQMKRARGKLDGVLEMFIKKAEGSPTWHYRVNAEALVRAIARVVLRGFLFIKAWFYECVDKPIWRISKMDSEDSRKSLTTESTPQLQTDSVSDLLILNGVNRSEAAKLAGLPRAVVSEFIAVARTKNKPGAYLLWMCRKWAAENSSGIQAKTLPIPQPLPHSDREGEITPPLTPLQTQGGEQRELDLRREEISPAAIAWGVALNQLEVQLDRANFDIWLRDTRLVANQGDTFVVACRNQYVVDNCQLRLYRTIRRVLGDVWGSPVEIRFVMQGAGHEHEQAEVSAVAAEIEARTDAAG